MSYRAEVLAIPDQVRAEMTGVSWRPDPRCPAFDQLALVRLVHWDMAGVERDGELVVAASVAEDVARAFERIHAARFPIERMVRIDAYGGNDARSMSDNNSSAFNFRTILNTDKLSLHSFGTAIDINPVQNPYVSTDRVMPPEAAAYLDRAHLRPGMIVRPGPVTDAFDAIGWTWGGDWESRKDYQHFSFQLEAQRGGPR
ncbi:MAG TPA: M15 family metallopeptidase [Kofleriaceae bacterium]|nr:M15 family metallopeptidase [Kofleriaceae bacterium]